MGDKREWDRCPVAASFLRQAEKDLEEGYMPFGLINDVVEDMKNITADIYKGRRRIQVLRAFYCLSQMHAVMLPSKERPDFVYTREGVIDIVKGLEEFERSESIEKMETAFEMRRGELGAELNNEAATENAENAVFLIGTAKFLRPKLKNDDSLGPMGKRLAQGMKMMNATSEQLKHCLDDLANISDSNPILVGGADD